MEKLSATNQERPAEALVRVMLPFTSSMTPARAIPWVSSSPVAFQLLYPPVRETATVPLGI